MGDGLDERLVQRGRPGTFAERLTRATPVPTSPTPPVREALEGIANLVARCHSAAGDVHHEFHELARWIDPGLVPPAGAAEGRASTERPDPLLRSVLELLQEVSEGLVALEQRLQVQGKELNLLRSRV